MKWPIWSLPIVFFVNGVLNIRDRVVKHYSKPIETFRTHCTGWCRLCDSNTYRTNVSNKGTLVRMIDHCNCNDRIYGGPWGEITDRNQ